MTDSSSKTSTYLLWCVLLLLSACVVAVAFRTRDCFVDDAFTGFQYLHNLLTGHGFVFRIGEPPVEGVTNIGWLLFLAPWCLGFDVEPTIVAKLVGLALTLLSLILMLYVGRVLAFKTARPADSFGLVLPPVLMLATSFEFIYFSLAGMETSLLAVLLLAMACVTLSRPHSIWLPVLSATAFLVHPEAAAVYPMYVMLDWIHDRKIRRMQGVGLLLFAALLGLITAGRWVYFHDLAPNTFYAKPGSLKAAIHGGYAFLMGRNVNVAFPITGWLALPLLWLGYRRIHRAAAAAGDWLAAVSATGLLFALYSPQDWSETARYFAPYLPAALVLVWAGVIESLPLLLGARASDRIRHALAAVVMLILVLTNVVDGRRHLDQLGDFPGYVLAGRNLVAPARALHDRLPPGATIATRRIGALAYYSDHPVFDYAYGLPDRHVARLVARHGGRFDTPTDPALADAWRARSPDYLLEDDVVMDWIMARSGGDARRFVIHGIPYRVVDRMPIGREATWTLAEQIKTP